MRFDPLEVETEKMRSWAQKIAEQAISEQDIVWRTIYKKVAMSPIVFMCHGYAVSNNLFQGDIGDFLNFCVRFTMDKGFGAIPAMVTGRTSIQTVVDKLAAMNQSSGGEGNIIPV
jgi:hypothetical protein